MLAHRLRRRPNIEPTDGRCPVFAGMESQRWSLKDHRHCFTVLSQVITFSRVEMLVDCRGGGGGGRCKQRRALRKDLNRSTGY